MMLDTFFYAVGKYFMDMCVNTDGVWIGEWIY
jgi:hypothetical protein